MKNDVNFDSIYDFVTLNNRPCLGGEQLLIKVAHSLLRINKHKTVLRVDNYPEKISNKEMFIYKNNDQRGVSEGAFFSNSDLKFDLIVISFNKLKFIHECVMEDFLNDEIDSVNIEKPTNFLSKLNSYGKDFPEKLNIYAEALSYLLENNLKPSGQMIVLDESSFLSGQIFYEYGDINRPADLGFEFRTANSYRLECLLTASSIIKQGPYEDSHRANSQVIVLNKKKTKKILIEDRFDPSSNYLFSAFDQWYLDKKTWTTNDFNKGAVPKPNSSWLPSGSIMPIEYFGWHAEGLAPDQEEKTFVLPHPTKSKDHTEKVKVFKEVLQSISHKNKITENRVLFFNDLTLDSDDYFGELMVKNYRSIRTKADMMRDFKKLSQNDYFLSQSGYEHVLALVELVKRDQIWFNTTDIAETRFSNMPDEIISESQFSLSWSSVFHNKNNSNIGWDHAIIDYTEGFYKFNHENLLNLLISFQNLKTCPKKLFLIVPNKFLNDKRFLEIRRDFFEFVSHLIIGSKFSFLTFDNTPQSEFFYYKNNNSNLLSLKLKSNTSWFKNERLNAVDWTELNNQKEKPKDIEDSLEIIEKKLDKVDESVNKGFKETKIMISKLSLDIKNIKSNEDLEEEEKIKEIEKSIEKNIQHSNIDEREIAIKKWIKDWDFIEKPNSAIFMRQAEYLLEILKDSNDLSPFIIQYSRAVENELLQKIFLPYHNNFFQKNKDIEEMVEIDNNIEPKLNSDKKRKIKNELGVFRRHLLNKDNNKYTLGTMAIILKHLSEKKYCYSHTKLLKDFEDYIKEKVIFKDDGFIENLEVINKDYRIKAAHPNLMNYDKAETFYVLIKSTLNQLIDLFEKQTKNQT
jgi:hypothetical protein